MSGIQPSGPDFGAVRDPLRPVGRTTWQVLGARSASSAQASTMRRRLSSVICCPTNTPQGCKHLHFHKPTPPKINVIARKQSFAFQGLKHTSSKPLRPGCWTAATPSLATDNKMSDQKRARELVSGLAFAASVRGHPSISSADLSDCGGLLTSAPDISAILYH